MPRVVAFDHLTLDGVMQAPADPDEDRRDGFEHGGWALPYGDSVMHSETAKGMTEDGALLLGRRTYEHFASVWPHMPEDNPFTAVINNSRKYVASTTLQGPLAWNNSMLLEGDAADAVKQLTQQEDSDLVILGSGELVQSLMRHNLIDEYRINIHPLVLGSGRRLFTDGGTFAGLRLVDAKTTATGVVMATYRPAESSDG